MLLVMAGVGVGVGGDKTVGSVLADHSLATQPSFRSNTDQTKTPHTHIAKTEPTNIDTYDTRVQERRSTLYFK